MKREQLHSSREQQLCAWPWGTAGSAHMNSPPMVILLSPRSSRGGTPKVPLQDPEVELVSNLVSPLSQFQIHPEASYSSRGGSPTRCPERCRDLQSAFKTLVFCGFQDLDFPTGAAILAARASEAQENREDIQGARSRQKCLRAAGHTAS